MKTLQIENASVVLENGKFENLSVLIEGENISKIYEPNQNGAVSDAAIIDLSGATLFAGFIDIHNHGAVGIDVNNANSDGLRAVGEFLAGNGVTAWMPTFVPDSDETYRKVIRAIEDLIKIQADLPIAQIIGVHYEGVFANEK